MNFIQVTKKGDPSGISFFSRPTSMCSLCYSSRMLHFERARLEKLAARQAAGDDMWSDNFDSNLRNKIKYLTDDLGSGAHAVEARRLIMREVGLNDLAGYGLFDEAADFTNYIMSCSDAMMPTVIEAFLIALQNRPHTIHRKNELAEDIFVTEINTMLREYFISYQLADGRMVPLSSLELHAAVIEPAVKLLTHTAGWESVEKPYMEALEEIGKGNAGNAITDSGTALQEALVLLGCEGKSLGPLISSGIKRGIIAAHDREMLEFIEKLMHWVSADRSTLGDGHNSEEPAIEDAWFSVHVVGAILVRLNKGSLRGKPKS